MRIHPPSPTLGPIAAAVARQVLCLMPEHDALDVANNVVGLLAMSAELGEPIDAQAAFTKRLREMVRDFGAETAQRHRFFCADVEMAGRLMAAEYRRQVALERRAQRAA